MKDNTNKSLNQPTITQRLLLQLKSGEVITTRGLRALGVSARLANYLKQHQVLTSVGVGAYVRGNDTPSFSSALEKLSSELVLPVHVGGLSSLSILGTNQYLTLGTGGITWIFSSQKLKLPVWFTSAQWKSHPKLIQTQFLHPQSNETLQSETIDGFQILVSVREQSILEAISLIEKHHSFQEIDDIFESLMTLDSSRMQNLLENCHSIKVCRVFLYLARKHNHPWSKKLDESRIQLGSGNRVVAKNGRLDSRYLITVPTQESLSDV